MAFNNQCIWTATVSYNGESRTVSYPLTCEFNIEKPGLADAKYLTLNIYNLSSDNVNSDFFRQNILHDVGKTKIIEFTAGYENNLITCFRGLIKEAYSSRRNTDIITTIQAYDFGIGGLNVQPTSVTFKAGTSFAEAFDYVASKLQYIQPEARGVLEGVYNTDVTFVGTPLQILNQITNNHTFVDNASLFCLNNNEFTNDEPIVLDSLNGLLGTPEIRDNWVTAKCIFNPRVRPAQRVILNCKSPVSNFSNGTYKVFGFNHQGIISGAVGGQRITTISMMYKDSLPNSNVNITSQTERQGEKLVEGTKVYTPSKEYVDNVYQYIRQNNGAIPPWRINNNISWYNMIGNNNSPEERYNQITPAIISNCIIIAKKLQDFINSSSLKGQKFIVSSGWRSIQNNAKSGGDPSSVHLKGGAIDFYFTSTSTKLAYDKAFKSSWSTYTYYKQKYNIIHVQNTLGKGGAKRNWNDN